MFENLNNEQYDYRLRIFLYLKKSVRKLTVTFLSKKKYSLTYIIQMQISFISVFIVKKTQITPHVLCSTMKVILNNENVILHWI